MTHAQTESDSSPATRKRGTTGRAHYGTPPNDLASVLNQMVDEELTPKRRFDADHNELCSYPAILGLADSCPISVPFAIQAKFNAVSWEEY